MPYLLKHFSIKTSCIHITVTYADATCADLWQKKFAFVSHSSQFVNMLTIEKLLKVKPFLQKKSKKCGY